MDPPRLTRSRVRVIYRNGQAFFRNRLFLDYFLPDVRRQTTVVFKMAATSSKHVQLALGLPSRLLTFLARYPPTTILPPTANPETAKTGYQQDTPNPFLHQKHPVTGRWHDPKYSLRRQADLVKMARAYGVEELLPYTPKKTEERLRKRVELGLRVKGTGVGQKVKGHKHERHLVSKYVCCFCFLPGE